jgi:hypothetical protein
MRFCRCKDEASGVRRDEKCDLRPEYKINFQEMRFRYQAFGGLWCVEQDRDEGGLKMEDGG